jgi:hypothetical protein
MREQQDPSDAGQGQEAAADDTRDENGVDITLIDEMLRMEPIERLRWNDRAVNAVMALRRAFANEQQ